MTAASRPRTTPTVALACLRELSADLRAVLLLDGAGAPLAGDEVIAAPARDLLAALAAVCGAPPAEWPVAPPAAPAPPPAGGPPAPARPASPVVADLVVRTAAGLALAARDGERAVVAAARPRALVALLRRDLHVVLADLVGGAPRAPLGPRDLAVAGAEPVLRGPAAVLHHPGATARKLDFRRQPGDLAMAAAIALLSAAARD